MGMKSLQLYLLPGLYLSSKPFMLHSLPPTVTDVISANSLPTSVPEMVIIVSPSRGPDDGNTYKEKQKQIVILRGKCIMHKLNYNSK